MLHAVDSICLFSSPSNPWAFSAKQKGLFFNVTITAALWGDITWIRICFDGQCINLMVLFWEVKSFFFLIGGKLLYSVVLVSAIQQCKSAIILHLSPPSWIFFPPPSHSFRSSQSARLGSLCYTETSYQLSVLHMVVYICQCYFEKLNLKVKIPCLVGNFFANTAFRVDCSCRVKALKFRQSRVKL